MVTKYKSGSVEIAGDNQKLDILCEIIDQEG